MDERERIAEILFHPMFDGSMARDSLWLSVHLENFKHTMLKHFPLCRLAAWVLRRINAGEVVS